MVTQGAGMAEVRLGASVPFEAESLLGARVRADQSHGLLMVLRNFSNLDSTYILPWRDAPLSFAMNRFDQSLHSVVEEIAATTPYAVSRAVRRVKLSGVAGLPMAKLEQEKMETERLREACISSALVARLVMESKSMLTSFVVRPLVVRLSGQQKQSFEPAVIASGFLRRS